MGEGFYEDFNAVSAFDSMGRNAGVRVLFLGRFRFQEFLRGGLCFGLVCKRLIVHRRILLRLQ